MSKLYGLGSVIMHRNRRKRGEDGRGWVIVSAKQIEDMKVMIGKMKAVIKKGVGEIGEV